MKIKKLIVILIVFLNTFVFIICKSNVIGFAENDSNNDDSFIGYSSNLTREGLERATTTTYFGDITYPSESYSYEPINKNIVDESAPLLTVLVHGHGSNASIWSNGVEFYDPNNSQDNISLVKYREFAYDPESIIEQLRRISNANVYYGGMNENGGFNLYRINDLSENYENVKEYYDTNGKIETEHLNSIKYVKTENVIKQITDISKHTIVVFNSMTANSSNEIEYDSLNYMIDKIVYDIKLLNNNKLPKINLIAHSRGGLTALQYAMDHPTLVDSVFTIGSPFLGSRMGTSEKLRNVVYGGAYDAGMADVLNPNLYNAYQTRWNDGYDDLYKEINFHTIGSYCSLEFVSYVAINDSYRVTNNVLKTIISELNKVKIFQNTIIGVTDLIARHSADSDIRDAIIAITDSMVVENFGDLFTGRLIIEDDLFIHLESQLGEGYTGFNRYTKCFEIDNCNLNKLAEPNTAIPHNLEPRDEMIISYIIVNITMNGKRVGGYITYDINQSCVGIKRYYGKFNEETLTVPATIDGKVVTEIDEFAFTNLRDNEKVKIIIIPATVEIIKHGAFYGCVNIENIEFLDGSNLEVIQDSAFRNCSLLENIVLPDTLVSLGEKSFYGCSSLNSITIGENVSNIGSASFAYCDIDFINLSEENVYYGYCDDAIYKSTIEGNVLVYSCTKSVSYKIPNCISSIGEFAFYGNNHIFKINLNNVEDISDYAFYECDDFGSIEYPKTLVNIHENSFYECDNIENVYYKGTLEEWCALEFNNAIVNPMYYAEHLYAKDNNNVNYQVIELEIPSSVTSIGDYQFYGLDDLETVIIPSNVTNVGNNSFAECVNLSVVELKKETIPLVNVISNAFDGCILLEQIKVPSSKIIQYKNFANLSDYRDIINPSEDLDIMYVNCYSDISEDEELQSRKSIVYELNVDCIKEYNIICSTTEELVVYLYDSNMELSGIYPTYSNSNHTATFITELPLGVYYLEISYSDYQKSGSISTTISPSNGSIHYTKTTGMTSILPHLHKVSSNTYKAQFSFTPTYKTGLHKLSLSGTTSSGSNIVFGSGSISVYDNLSKINPMYQYSMLGLDNLAVSGGKEILVYLEKNETYYIDVTLPSNQYSTLNLQILPYFNCEIGAADLPPYDISIMSNNKSYGSDLCEFILHDPMDFTVTIEGLTEGKFIIYQEIINEEGIISYSLVKEESFTGYFTDSFSLEAGSYYIGYIDASTSNDMNYDIMRIVVA